MTETLQPPPATSDGIRPVRLRPPRYRVERRAILWWTVSSFIRYATILGGLAISHGVVESARPWTGPIMTILGVYFFVTLMVMPTRRYLIHRWESTDQAVYSLKGWLTREWRITPISRIQTIDTHRGPLQQLLGLASLRVTTAASQGAITIVGLDAEVAAQTAERLTKITQATPGDAT
jgi:uncharacterized protein